MSNKFTWEQIKKAARLQLDAKSLEPEYSKRLEFEFKEIEKQKAEALWCNQFNNRKTYKTNDNGLVLPWILKLTPVDPLLVEHKIVQSTDWPDIDFDCLPEARDPIKAYAAEKYGHGQVCSVGLWQTYKLKSAIQDSARGLGEDWREAEQLTKNLPDDVDGLKDGGYSKCTSCGHRHKAVKCPKCGHPETDDVTLGKLLDEYDKFKEYATKYPEVVKMAVRLVGKLKTMGKHAGGLIIANTELLGKVPMALSKGSDGSKQWTSMWTEGRNTQLSKFGYIKWDCLGLKTLQYIHDACKLIESTRGYKFNTAPWEGNDPHDNCMGYYWNEKGEKLKVTMDDPDVYKMMNDIRVETVFQFETDVQRGVLNHGVRNFDDLQVFNAMGHPGPIAFIPEYVNRRDDTCKTWKRREHDEISALLEDTYGIIVYQEQLQMLWQRFAAFTAPEAEKARKAVAKKWTEKLKDIQLKWMEGSTPILGEQWASEMWERMKTFGRYAFNKSHSCAYIIEAYWCAWLKVHFAPEWFASVMSTCHNDKIPRYMTIARKEGVEFAPIDVENLTKRFSVDKELHVTPGLISLKGVGEKAAAKLEGHNKIKDIDDFITIHGKSKTVLQRLILLGAFERFHSNIKATWMWYQYKYCTGKDITQLRKEIKEKLLGSWTEEKIEAERKRQADEYFSLYPNRKKLPKKIENWNPKAEDTRENVMALFPEDYDLSEILEFEKQYLGYYWHNPMEMFRHSKTRSIAKSKQGHAELYRIDAIVEEITHLKTKTGNSYTKVCINDGIETANIYIWSSAWKNAKNLVIMGAGLTFKVKYDKDRNSFSLARGTTPVLLSEADDPED